MVNQEVASSLTRLYDDKSQSSTIVFSEPKPAHDYIREQILANAAMMASQQQRKENESEKSGFATPPKAKNGAS
jgi:hypothetical protein